MVYVKRPVKILFGGNKMVRTSQHSHCLGNSEMTKYLIHQILSLEREVCIYERDIIKEQCPRIKQELEKNQEVLKKEINFLKEKLNEKPRQQSE